MGKKKIPLWDRDGNLFTPYTYADRLDEMKYSKIQNVMHSDDNYRKEPLISRHFTKELLAKIYLLATDYTVDDNNERAEYIVDLLKPYGFAEIGTGTNRTALLKDNYVFKIALDRRGFVDNMSEYFRSIERPDALAKVYETNKTIVVAEYVNLFSKEDYDANKEQLKRILDSLDKDYIMDDLGITAKNYCNWGYRQGSGQIVALDYAYLYPKKGNEHVLICSCGARIKPNSTYSGYECSNAACKLQYTAAELQNHMNINDHGNENDFIDVAGGHDDKKVKVSSDGDFELMSDSEVREIKETRERLLSAAKKTEVQINSTPLAKAFLDLQEAAAEDEAEKLSHGRKELKTGDTPYDVISRNTADFDSEEGITEDEFMAMMEKYDIMHSSNVDGDDDFEDGEDAEYLAMLKEEEENR